MREELLCWFALLFTACVVWLWVDLLRERREARRERKHKGNTQTPPAAKSRENARKRPLRTGRTPAGGTTPSVAADAAPPPSMREARTTPPALRATSPYTGEAQKARELYDITGRELPTYGWRAPDGRLVRLLPPTVTTYDQLCGLPFMQLIDGKKRTPEALRALYALLRAILCNNLDDYTPPEDSNLRQQLKYTSAILLLSEYTDWIASVLSAPRLRLPSAQTEPEEDEIPVRYSIETAAERAVSAYSGLSVQDTRALSIVDFRILRRDALIYNLSGTRKGREYLQLCWCAEQTEPDRVTLRSDFGGRG